MAKQNFEIRFDHARVRLNATLKELEKTISDKLHETALKSRVSVVTGDDSLLNSKVDEQFSTIQNLNSEINKLQENLFELGQSNDSLIEENAILTSNLNKLRTQGSTLAQAIESDLISIEEIISGEKNG